MINMKANWIIYNNHLALQDGKNVYHPNASDIYSLLSNNSSLKFEITAKRLYAASQRVL